MCSKNETRVAVELAKAFLMMLILFSGCRGGLKGPLSADEVLNADAPVPIHYVDPSFDTNYEQLEAVYYYPSDSSEVLLVTYFTAENSAGERVRVARMSTCKFCGQLVNIDETRGEAPLPIVWAKETTGSCRAHPPAHRENWITGDPFQSCLYWIDEDGIQYKLYTVWSEEEAVHFANSLSVLKNAIK